MTLGIMGCGKMGRALAIGAMDAGAVAADDVLAFDVIPAAVEELARQRKIRAAHSPREIATSCEVVLLCTKPGDVPAVLDEIAATGPGDHQLLILSVAAGVTIDAIEQRVAGHARVIRAMPNTPALIGRGAAAYALGSTATEDDASATERLLGAVGSVVRVKEPLLDTVTGLSGSGPGYVYLFIEALTDGGVLNGLPRDQALALATQTVLGAATMIQSTGQHPAALKDMVTSPGGTTMAGLASLETNGFRAACLEAVTAATERARELGRG